MARAVLLPLVAVSVLVAWRRGWFPARTWLLVAALQLALVGSAMVALNTGEKDEDRAEKVVAESAIEAHEDAGKLFTLAAVAVFLLAAGTLIPRRDETRQVVAAVAVAGSAAVAGLGFNVGHKGGELVYRHGAGSAYASPSLGNEAGSVASPRARHDDDDD